MKIKGLSFLLVIIFVLMNVTIFGAAAPRSATPAGGFSAGAGFLTNEYNLEYCTVDLADRKSNLNVRTWEGRVTGKLRHGTRVWVNEYSGEWARVSVKRGRKWVSIGWVDSNYLLC